MSRADRVMRSARRAASRPAGAALKPLRRARVQRAIAELPGDQRLLLALCLIEGLTTAEAAELTGLSRRAVAATCDRILTSLRRAMRVSASRRGAAPASEASWVRRAV